MEFVIRPYDVDVAGIVSNIVYVRWLEDLRMELWSRFLPEGELLARDLMHVLVRTEIDYRASLRFLDKCTGGMRVSSIGRTSVTMEATFRTSERVVAEARQVGVLIRQTTHRPVPLPEDLRRLLGAER